MQQKPMVVIIVVLAILTSVNICGILMIDHIEAKPHNAYCVEVFGAAFKAEAEAESNVIDINLIRPPREVVYPGNTSHPDAIITNTAECETYLRATYRIDIKTGEGDAVDGFMAKVQIEINPNWYYSNGYWYYHTAVQPGEKVDGPIKSIAYSEDFNEHLDYKVYIPVLIESVETNGNSIEAIDYWPNKNIQSINVDAWINKKVTWTQKITIF